MKIELREHQAEAIQKMHNGCVLWGDVGTGKTIAALAYCLLKEAGKHIVVITTAKKRDSQDWQNEAALLGVPFDGIEVESWNKIGEYIDRENQMFIFDEQRLVGTGAWVKHFYKIAKANSWILLSATPGDTWSDYAPMFIANGWYKNITEFRREHAVYSRFTQFPKIERYIGENKLKRYRQQLLVKMPMARHTTRHMIYLDCEWDQEKLDIVRKKRWNPFTDEPIKSAAEMFTAMRRIVSEDDSRRRQFEALLQQHDKMIVFYNFNYELEILRDILEKHQASMKSTSTRSDGLVENLSEISTPSKSLAILTRGSESSRTTTSTRTPSESRALSTAGSRISFDDPSLRSTQNRIASLSTSSSSEKIRASASTGSEPPAFAPSTTKEDKSCPRSPATASKSSARPSVSPSAMSVVGSSRSGSTSPMWKSPQPPRKSGSITCVQSPMTEMHGSRPLTTGTSRSTTTRSADSLLKSRLSSSGSGSFAWSEWNGHKHEPVPSTDRWVYLVQYASGSEGWNCIETNVMVFWSLTYSWKQFWQAQGRIDRLNTKFTDLLYYILRTKSQAELPVIQSLNKKEDFQPK